MKDAAQTHPLRIDIIGFEDCPNMDPTLQRVRDAAAALNVTVDVRPVLLSEHDDPVRLRFLGSPTVLIADKDIDPAARTRTDFGFGCRVYGDSGTPPMPMIEAAVREAKVQIE